MHRVSTFLISESRRIDETTLAASSALVSSESSPASTSKRSTPASPPVGEERGGGGGGGGGEAFCVEGLQTEIGRTFRGSSEAFLREPLAPAVEDEGCYAPAISNTSAEKDHSYPLT